jgi:hypothetical protein
MRAVQTQYSSLVHLDVGTTRTKCGVLPYKNAPAVIHRDLMCMNCFGLDHGVGKITASMIGVQKIYERKAITKNEI